MITNEIFDKPDIIIMVPPNLTITDKEGNKIEIKVPRPEYTSEIFS